MAAAGSWRGAACGLGAALLFGASAPLAKRFLSEAGPVVLAALFYLGAGAGLGLARLGRRASHAAEARLGRGDVPALVGVLVLGGLVGPILMLVGLERLSAVSGALLLNLEAPFTILVALVWFREHLGWPELSGAACILLGAVVLTGAPAELAGEPVGVAAIAGACLCWAVDNNLTQRLSLRDPVAVARLKTTGAGAIGAVLALAVETRVPSAAIALAALGVGAVSYGASILLDVYALRLVGAAREAAYFATAPFFGAALAVPLLGEAFGAGEGLAGLLMGLGVMRLARAQHSHWHEHEAITHAHAHVHDVHHDHAHDEPVDPGVVHSHVHTHRPLAHEHPHVSDAHHRHRH